jgi:signal peptidase I
MLAMRRIVYDNDHLPTDLGPGVPPRWAGDPGWTNAADREFTQTKDSDTDSWVRYRHLLLAHGVGQPRPEGPVEPSIIRNFMGYNYADTGKIDHSNEDKYWVGDLMVECNVDVAAGAGEFLMELSKGPDRYQARFDLSTGVCRLMRVGKVSATEIGKAETKLKGTGKHFVRFANFDERLTVWVDQSLPFGDGLDYSGDRSGVPDDVNDKQPASVGSRGPSRLTVRNLKLFRDTYYTAGGGQVLKGAGDPDLTLFVQPGHYLCMGDNSSQSSDGLMLGKALIVYFPVWPLAPRFGPIR